MEKFLKKHITHHFLILFFFPLGVWRISSHCLLVLVSIAGKDWITDHTCSKQDHKGEVTDSCRHLQENTAQTKEE